MISKLKRSPSEEVVQRLVLYRVKRGKQTRGSVAASCSPCKIVGCRLNRCKQKGRCKSAQSIRVQKLALPC